MNISIRLSGAAFFLLFVLSITFTLGFQMGKSSADQAIRQPANGGIVNTR